MGGRPCPPPGPALYPQATSGGKFYWTCKGTQVLEEAQETRKEAWAAGQPLPLLAKAKLHDPGQ